MLLKIFHFSTLWIWLSGIFDKRQQGCDEVKNSIGHLHGPRLMALTTKSPIRGNHWVPWGCGAHLGSVRMCDLAKWWKVPVFKDLVWFTKVSQKQKFFVVKLLKLIKLKYNNLAIMTKVAVNIAVQWECCLLCPNLGPLHPPSIQIKRES